MPAQYRVSLLCALALAAAAAVPAQAEERILSFDSRIVVSPDMSLDVTETIAINVEGTNIKRGIVKDLPAAPKAKGARAGGLSVKVLDVTRDGVKEPFRIEPGQTATQLRIGKADVLLPAKATTYVIHYRVTRPNGSPDKFNELQWDVTGNSWALPIDAAVVTVDLPKGSQIVQSSAILRLAEGKTQRLQAATGEGAQFTARSDAPLMPGTHFSVLVEWPKGMTVEGGGAMAQFAPLQWTTKRKHFGSLQLQ